MWTEEVHRNRLAVARATLSSGGPARGSSQLAKRRLLPGSERAANSGLAPIALATGLLAGALYWQKEGHKLRGRKLPSWLEPLRPVLRTLWPSGGARGASGRRAGSGAAGGSARRPAPAAQRQAQQQQQTQAQQRALAAAAAEQRLRQVGTACALLESPSEILGRVCGRWLGR